MKQLIYVSQAVTPFTPEQINALTEQSCIYNKKLNITGCLLYTSGYFLQLLEGSCEAIDDLYFKKIEKDSRHKNIKLLIEQEVDGDKRIYEMWFMATFNVDNNREIPDALKKSIQNIAQKPSDKSEVKKLFVDLIKHLDS